MLPLCKSQERNKQAPSHEMQEHTCSLSATHKTPYLFPKTPYVQGYQILAGRESLVIGHIQSLYGHRLVYTHETKNSFPAKVTFIKTKMYELFYGSVCTLVSASRLFRYHEVLKSHVMLDDSFKLCLLYLISKLPAHFRLSTDLLTELNVYYHAISTSCD